MATEIASLTEVKVHLNKISNADDTEILDMIAAADSVVEFYTGPVITKTITERHRDSSAIALYRPPVESLTSVTAVYSTGTSWTVGDLDVDEVAGIITRANGQPLYGGPWDVVYDAGRATVSGNIKLAHKIILKHLWETQRGSMKQLPINGGEVPMVTGVSYAVPRRALELLRPDSAAAGIA